MITSTIALPDMIPTRMAISAAGSVAACIRTSERPIR